MECRDIGLHVTDVLLGVKLSDVFDAAVSFVKKEKPQFVDKLTKSAGLVNLYYLCTCFIPNVLCWFAWIHMPIS